MSKTAKIRCENCGFDIADPRGHLSIGTRVLLIGKHPWKGHVGQIVKGLRNPSIKIMPAMYTIRIEAGNEFMARPDELKVIEG